MPQCVDGSPRRRIVQLRRAAMTMPAGEGHDDNAPLHGQAARQLTELDQRYTRNRRAIVRVLSEAERPLTIPELVERADGMPQSSAYRNLTVLCEAGVARRLAGVDDFGRYELAEDLAGHHHHIRCVGCATVADFTASPALEKALAQAAGAVGAQSGYRITGHSLDFEGRCQRCS